MARRRCKLDTYRQHRLVEFFVGGVTARTAAQLVGINRHSATLFYHKLREIIAYELDQENPFLGNEFELDESYFGGHRKGNRGRGAAGKIPVFGILERKGKVYTKIIPDASTATLMPIIQSKVIPDSIVYTDSWKAYHALDVNGFQHERVNHSETYVDTGNRKNHINGIENFWSQAKRHLRKFNGIPKNHFHLYLKECEFRFNYPDIQSQIKIIKIWKRKHLI